MNSLHARLLAIIIEDMWLEEVQILMQRCRHFMVSFGSRTSNLAFKELVQYGSSNHLRRSLLRLGVFCKYFVLLFGLVSLFSVLVSSFNIQ